MSKTLRNRMLEKVRALLNKGDTSRGSTPEEAQSAMAKAQELMTKHNIDMMDAQELDTESCFSIGRDDVKCDRGRRNADSYVTIVLKKCFGVDIVYSTHYRPGVRSSSLMYVIMGDETDREMAKIALPIIYKTMTGGLSAWLRTNHRTWSAALERSYCDGVAEGYILASDEGKALALKHLTKEQAEQFGLILFQKDALITAFKEKEFPELKFVRTRPGFGSALANQAGFSTGARMNLLAAKRI